MDLGETGSNIYNGFSTSSGGSFPDNTEANNLFNALSSTYSGVRNINEVNSVLGSTPLSNGEDYEKLERSRKLSESEFTINSQLGYISLNSALNNDEVLAVAFQYKVGSLKKLSNYVHRHPYAFYNVIYFSK